MSQKQSTWRRALRDPEFFAKHYLDFHPHPGQSVWLRCSTGRENALVTGNRWGKSEIQAVKLLHRCLFQIRLPEYDCHRRYRALNVSITADQAQIVFSKVLSLLERNKHLKALVRSVRATPFPTIVFRNHSELTARTSANRGEYLLGHDYDYVNFDEVAYELHPEAVVDGVIKMRLADRAGVLDYSSTPNGYNWFYRRCQQIREEGRGFVYQGSSYENPYLPRESLDYLRRTMSPARVAQHLDGQFASFVGRLFPESVLQSALQNGCRPGGPVAGHAYVHGWDLARKQTFTVGVVLDVTSKPYQLVHIERYQRDWPLVIDGIRKLHARFGGRVIIDSTGIGDVILSSLADIGAEGFNFAAGNRERLLANLERALFSGEVGLYEETLVSGDSGGWSLLDELRALDAGYEHVGDGVCALALAVWGADRTDRVILPPLPAAVAAVP